MDKELPIKKQLLHTCKKELVQRKANIQDRLDDIVSGLQSETKSTAGDKHETGRAMLQIEREQVGRQLAETEKQEQVIKRIQIHKQARIALGAVVHTDKENYFLSIAMGAFVIDGISYYAIGLGSPLARILLGKTTGDQFHFRERLYTISNVF